MENFGLLNNDICFDVLSRLPTKDLLQLKCVCKRWCQLISDHIFRQVQSQKREPISGFFFQQKYQRFRYSDNIRSISYIPAELRGTGLHQSVFNFLPEDVLVMASCNGLVCCQSCCVSQDPALYVCNPLNKDWIRLCWTKPNIIDNIALAVDPCQDTAGSSSIFKLVSVQQFQTGSDDPYFSFNIYSSDSGSWKISQEICHCEENEKSWVISVPIQDAAALSEIMYVWCIGESDDQLHFIMVTDDGLCIWSLEDYFKFKWNLKYSRSLEVIIEDNPSLCRKLCSRWPMHPLAFKDGYLLMDDDSDICLYNIETNKMNEVFSVSELRKYIHDSCRIALPYSMSLVPLNSA